MEPKEIHAWEIPGYIKVDKELRDLIRNNLKNNYGSFRKAVSSLKLCSDYHHRLLDKYHKKSETLFKLIDGAKIPRNLVEKHIISWKDSKRDLPKGGYKIKFPIKINPIHTRIISHLIGDGNISINDTWVQKDVEPLEKLLKKLLKANLEKRKVRRGTEVITIPKFFNKLFSKIFNIHLEGKFDKKILIKKCLELPREHRIQVLTAIIEDEGNANGYNISIRMKDKEVMKIVKELIDSLGYDGGNLFKQNQKSGYSNKIGTIHGIVINVLGTKKYIEDLEKMEKKFGTEIGLWTKKEKAKKITKLRELISGKERNKKLEKQIFKNDEKVNFNEIKKNLELTDNETMSVLRYMLNTNKIKRINRGVYTKIR